MAKHGVSICEYRVVKLNSVLAGMKTSDRFIAEIRLKYKYIALGAANENTAVRIANDSVAGGAPSPRRRADHPVAIEVLMEAGLKRLQCRIGPRQGGRAD